MNQVKTYFSSGSSAAAGAGASWCVRRGAAATTVGNQICVFGGTSAGLDVSTTECLDPTSNTWASGLPHMPTFRHGLGADAIGGLAYAVGGYSGGNLSGGGPGYVSTVERYNPVARTWTSNASMLTTREYEGVVTMSGLHELAQLGK